MIVELNSSWWDKSDNSKCIEKTIKCQLIWYDYSFDHQSNQWCLLTCYIKWDISFYEGYYGHIKYFVIFKSRLNIIFVLVQQIVPFNTRRWGRIPMRDHLRRNWSLVQTFLSITTKNSACCPRQTYICECEHGEWDECWTPRCCWTFYWRFSTCPTMQIWRRKTHSRGKQLSFINYFTEL